MSEHKSNIESENERFEEAKTHDVRKDENFAAEDVGKDENFAVDDVGKDENFAVDDVRKDEHLVVDEVGKDEDFAVDDVRKDEDFAADDVRKEEDFALDDVGKDENFVENAVLSYTRHDASAENIHNLIFQSKQGLHYLEHLKLFSDRWTFEDELSTIQMMILFLLRRV